MNMIRSVMMPLWKGDQGDLKSNTAAGECFKNDFIIGVISWEKIDAEIVELGWSTPESVFGRRLRDTAHFKQWKAEECRMFAAFYAVVLLQGHLPNRYIDGLRMLSDFLELCFRPQLSDEGVTRISRPSLEFFGHYEKQYYRYEEERVHFCKSTVHALLHLAENIE